MKVLIYFSGKLNEPRGTPIRTRNQIEQLVQGGVEVYYAGYDQPEQLAPDHVLALATPLRRFAQLATFVREHSIDIVYVQTSAGMMYAAFLSLVTKAKVGVDFHSRRYQEEHVYKHRMWIHTACLELGEHILARFLDFGTGVSHTLKRYYAASVPTFLVLPVGVDLAVFSPQIVPDADIVAWKGGDMLIAYAGNTKWYQGIETVLSAFKQVSRAGGYKLLVIASSGSEDVQNYVNREGLGSVVRVLSAQPHHHIPALLSAADVLTVVRPLDLVTEYSFPSKLPEYAALGKCLVVSRVSDIERYITNHENGLVVAPGDVVELENAFLEAQDPELRAKVAHASRQLAETSFDLNRLGSQLCTFLGDISVRDVDA